jgi:hypothetical protein
LKATINNAANAVVIIVGTQIRVYNGFATAMLEIIKTHTLKVSKGSFIFFPIPKASAK